MAFMDWDGTLTLGIPSVDRQHKRLVDLINELYEAMKAGKGSSVMEKVIGELAAYTRTHFTFEEGLLEKAGYGSLAAHRLRHKAFVEQVETYAGQLKKGGLVSTVLVTDFLSKWLKEHILVEDKAYVETLLAKKVS